MLQNKFAGVLGVVATVLGIGFGLADFYGYFTAIEQVGGMGAGEEEFPKDAQCETHLIRVVSVITTPRNYA